MAETKVEVDMSRPVFEDIFYGNRYKCPACERSNIMDDYQYCPNCGVKFEWV